MVCMYVCLSVAVLMLWNGRSDDKKETRRRRRGRKKKKKTKREHLFLYCVVFAPHLFPFWCEESSEAKQLISQSSSGHGSRRLWKYAIKRPRRKRRRVTKTKKKKGVKHVWCMYLCLFFSLSLSLYVEKKKRGKTGPPTGAEERGG